MRRDTPEDRVPATSLTSVRPSLVAVAGRSELLKELMMEAFVVFTREEAIDSDALATYSAGVGPSFDGHDVTFLATYREIKHLEGTPVEGAVILRFPKMQAARDWYDSPAYQTIAAHRFDGLATTPILSKGSGDPQIKERLRRTRGIGLRTRILRTCRGSRQ